MEILLGLAVVLLGLAGTTAIGILMERLLGRPLDRLLFRAQQRWRKGTGAPETLNGIWKSRFAYESSQSAGELEDEYLIVLRQGRHGITGYSLDREEGSRLTLELKLERAVLTGTWQEYTPEGDRAYHGTCQLLLSPTGNELIGKWMGFRRDNAIGVGPWDWERIDTRTGRSTRRAHEHEPGLAWHRPVEATSAGSN